MVNFNTSVLNGIGPPVFKFWRSGQLQESVTLRTPDGAPYLSFEPNSIDWTDINNQERSIHFGWVPEFEFSYVYITPADIAKLIKVFTWRPSDIEGIRIQCFPHNDSDFNFYGRFTERFDFRYIQDKFLGHSITIRFRATELIQAIPCRLEIIKISRRLF